jgi:hypothetical protein
MPSALKVEVFSVNLGQRNINPRVSFGEDNLDTGGHQACMQPTHTVVFRDAFRSPEAAVIPFCSKFKLHEENSKL